MLGKIWASGHNGGPSTLATDQTTRHVCGEGGRRVLRETTNNLTGQKKRVIDFAGLAEIRPDEGIMLLRVPVNGAVMVEEARSLVDGGLDARQSGYLHTDIRGSTLAKTDWSEQMSLPFEEAEYGAWGETLRVSELDAPTHQFVGFEPDPATGWYFMGARVYNPALRRWLSPDPLLLAAPQVDSAEGLELNLYSYTGNNPVGFIDPTGNIRIASADYDSRAVGDDRRGQIAGSPPHFSPFVQGVSAAVMTGAMGMLAIAASGPVDVANAVDSAGKGNYAPAALSAGMAALPIGRLGRFVPRNRSMSVRAAKYQSQITGTAANIEFNLKGVDFDGLKDGVLLEAKGPGYAKFISKKTGEFEDWFDGATKLLDQARRQVNAAKGAKVEWHVAEEKAASTIKELLKSQRVKGINVKHIEPVD